MNTLSTWSPPVAVSLLLHAVLIALITHRMSVTAPDNKQVKTISVEMLGKMPAAASKPPLQKSDPVVTAAPAQKPIKSEPPAADNPSPEELQPATAATGLSNSKQQATNTATESSQPGLNIQPLSKLTRPPAFLHKIEPVYPGAEQRAGSQAYVLAEITIDAQGNVLEVKIMKSAGGAFDHAVTEALKKSIFMPGYIGKEAVAVRVLVPFRFNLR
jgi:TonB family protein